MRKNFTHCGLFDFQKFDFSSGFERKFSMALVMLNQRYG